VVHLSHTHALEGQLSSIIRVAGIDPSLANWGMSKMLLNTDTLALELEAIHTINTEPRGKNKVVRQNSDDLRRAGELYAGFQAWMKDCVIGFTEVPSGSQHSRSALAFGVAIGVLTSAPVQLIEVMPAETKAATGNPKADKPEIIDWAARLYPHVPWERYHKDVISRGKLTRRAGELHADNEHAADACAVIHAGIQTPQFKQLLALWKASRRILS
jgi:Holliday junction resolvasome RuvABC endonuclease subunit